MENIIQGKNICFVGNKYYDDRDILAAFMLGAQYVAKGIDYSGWTSFEQMHKGVDFDLFVYSKYDPQPYTELGDDDNVIEVVPDPSDIDPEYVDGLQRRFPAVQVIRLEEFRAIEASLPKPSSNALFEQLAKQNGFCLHLQLPLTTVLDFGHFSIPNRRFDSETELNAWKEVVLAYLNGLPAMEVIRKVTAEILPEPDEDMEMCHLPGSEEPFWHYQSSYGYPIDFDLNWTYPLAHARAEIAFDSLMELINPETGSAYGCLCRASIFKASKVRLHWRSWLDPATNGIAGFWVLECPPLCRGWNAKQFLSIDVEGTEERFLQFPESVQPIYKYFERGASPISVALVGIDTDRIPITETTFRNQVVHITDVMGCAYPPTFALMALGAKTVEETLSDQATMVVGLERQPDSEFRHLPYYSFAELDAYVLANHRNLLQTLQALLDNGYQLRNPSDEGWPGPDFHQGGEVLSPSDLPNALLDYIQSSPYVAKWAAQAYASRSAAKRGFEEIAIGTSKAYLRWEIDPYDYQINLQRGDAEDNRLDNMELNDYYFGAYWTYRVMALLNSEPSNESVDGLFIVAGMDNKDSTFQVVAVPRTWT
ncbi:MAG: hypothetical protein U0176_19225 [Bacteroidia bacterium]